MLIKEKKKEKKNTWPNVNPRGAKKKNVHFTKYVFIV